MYLHISVKGTVRVWAVAGEPKLRGAFRKEGLWGLFEHAKKSGWTPGGGGARL